MTGDSDATGGGPRLPPLVALSRFWEDDKGLSVFSALLAIVVFLVPPLVAPGAGRSLVGDLLYALLLLSGVHALGEHRLARRVLLPFALATIAVDLGSWLVPLPQVGIVGTGLVSLLLFLAVVLARTLRAGAVNFHRLLGGVAAYLLLGVIWAHAYVLVLTLRPDAFSIPIDPADGPRALFYFSFVTLTTVGYGDVAPVAPAARSLAMLEAVTGPLYLAILIARLVSQAPLPGSAAGSGDGGR